MLTIYTPNSEVTIWGNVKARIEYAVIEGGRISYRVRFWNGTSLASETIDESLILDGGPKQAIGFK